MTSSSVSLSGVCLLHELVDGSRAPRVLLRADGGQDEAQRVTTQIVMAFYGGDDVTVETLFQGTG
jgi:hypothetical protein